MQVLRAVAALMVVWHHATMLLEQRAGEPGRTWENGASGVDIFFVVSGLVMALSTARLRPSARVAGRFLLRRVERVAPLYWLATTAKVVLTAALPTLVLHANGTWWHVMASYLFLPSLGPARTLEPTLVVGWTLNLEMMFYVLMATGLLFGGATWRVVVPGLVGLILLRAADSRNVLLDAWGDPVVLEFVLGMALGETVLRGWRMPRRMAAAAMAVGFLALWMTPSMVISGWRPLVWGGPAMLIVAGALGMEGVLGARVPEWAMVLGDASYSIYLTHGFVLPALAIGGVGAILLRHGEWLCWVSLGLSAAAGVACYRAVELPMLEWFRLRRGGPESGVAGGSGRRWGALRP